jgi:hypothetical protein
MRNESLTRLFKYTSAFLPIRETGTGSGSSSLVVSGFIDSRSGFIDSPSR